MLYTEKTVPHTDRTQEAFLSCGPQPDVIYHLFLTVWSTKQKEMFDVLQLGGFISYVLLEAFVQIRDDATCNASHNGAVTDPMICAAPHSWFTGPCHVRCL